MGLGRPASTPQLNPGGYRFILIFTLFFFLKIYSNHCLSSWIVTLIVSAISATNFESADSTNPNSHRFIWSSHKYLFAWIEYLWIFLCFLSTSLCTLWWKGMDLCLRKPIKGQKLWSWAIDCNGTPAASFNLFRSFGGFFVEDGLYFSTFSSKIQ